ncbi:hypothetical protein KJ359_001917 [Pestalotiopsis sp. 9143b]|nr:hypothetical protein KJ359_001917 [Pestalotiopsis sp. 9143b]
MNRHTRLDRLASGVLFSRPADWATAVPDIPRHKKRIKAPQLGHTPQDNVAGVQQVYAGFAQTRGPAPSVFPYFLDATATKRHTDTESGLSDDGIGTLPPATKQSVTLCLPILSVSVDVTIDGRISYTKLTQSFLNPSEQAIPEARHTFPLYDGAVVTSFECEIGDVRRLQGVVKPKAQAKHDFEEARVNKREAAALLEELTPEIFETSLGNIPAKTKVDITLTYVHELKVVTSREEKSEGLAITIPTSLAPQYGSSKVSIPPSEIPSERLEINIKVLDNGTINPAACHIESDHHATYKGLEPVRNVVIASISELHHNDSEARIEPPMQHVWHYSSKSQPFLKRDFILVTAMHQETRLHSRAVITSPNEVGHAALMVSLRPNDIFGSAVRPESFSGEILFILDRSASMGWSVSGDQEFKINTMKRAVLLALAGLPSTCAFNIISFGSEVRGMWAESRECRESNLSHAREYTSVVKADMGGTQVLLALEGALKNRMRIRSSTQIILVTDGEVDYEPHNAILDCVLKARREFGDQVRFFTLGIGDNSAHGILESIAELGGGYCDVVDVAKSQRWESRFNRMLRPGMTKQEVVGDDDPENARLQDDTSSNDESPVGSRRCSGRARSLGETSATSGQLDVNSHELFNNDSISWENAVGCVKGGLFVLSDLLRVQLYLHFCEQTVERLCWNFQNSPIATPQNDEASPAILADTLMMIQYFKTHLAVEEDTWNLIVGKAEHSILLALGYEEDQEAMLEPRYEMLLSAIFHAHLPEAMKHAAIEKGETNESVDSLSIETCLMCDTLIEATTGKAFQAATTVVGVGVYLRQYGALLFDFSL